MLAVGFGLKNTSMACRGSGVRVSLAPFLEAQSLTGFSCVWGLSRSGMISLVGVISGVICTPQALDLWQVGLMVLHRILITSLTSRRKLPSTTLMLPHAAFLRTPKSRLFLQSSRTQIANNCSALTELNLAVHRLQGGVLRSATTSPQTSRRVQGPTCRLSSTGISPIR